MGKNKIIVVDGANVAYTEKTNTGKPKMSNLIALQRELEHKGFNPIIIVDASLKYEIDDPEQLEGLLQAQSIRQAPANTQADYFILKTSEEYKSKIVSNDMFEQYKKEFSWIQERRVPLMIINGKVELYEEQLGSGK